MYTKTPEIANANANSYNGDQLPDESNGQALSADEPCDPPEMVPVKPFNAIKCNMHVLPRKCTGTYELNGTTIAEFFLDGSIFFPYISREEMHKQIFMAAHAAMCMRVMRLQNELCDHDADALDEAISTLERLIAFSEDIF